MVHARIAAFSPGLVLTHEVIQFLVILGRIRGASVPPQSHRAMGILTCPESEAVGINPRKPRGWQWTSCSWSQISNRGMTSRYGWGSNG